jgi:signal transduction histidine kinase
VQIPGVLDSFIEENRGAIVAAVCARFIDRASSGASSVAENSLAGGIDTFLTQVGTALRSAMSGAPLVQLRDTAGAFGNDMLLRGVTIGQVVHVYGDTGQAIAELALQQQIVIPATDARVLQICVDDAIAGAVTGYSDQRERMIQVEGTERLGMLAHELRTALSTGSLAYASLQTGQVAIGGSTGHLLGRSLARLASLIDRSLADVRLDAGINRVEPISVAGFLEELEISASMVAQAKGIRSAIPRVNAAVTIEGDRQILTSAVANLLQNAFKFTPQGATVSLTTEVTSDRVLFDVEDECGGLPPGKIDELFAPFSQRGSDRTGLGLGLSICLKAARASAGEIRVRDIPGKGCVFVLDLPRKTRASGHPGSRPPGKGSGDPRGGIVKAHAVGSCAAHAV